MPKKIGVLVWRKDRRQYETFHTKCFNNCWWVEETDRYDFWSIQSGDLKSFSQKCDYCVQEINLECSQTMPELFTKSGYVRRWDEHMRRPVRMPAPSTIKKSVKQEML